MITKRIPFLLLIPLALSGCILAGGSNGGELAEVETSRVRWNGLEWADYDMTLRRSCFCIGAGTYTVTVRNDSVVAVVPADENTQPVAFTWWSEIFPTVDDLLDLAERARREADQVVVDYNDHGWPTRLDIDWIAQAVDDELSYEVVSVTEAAHGDVADIAFGSSATLMGLAVRFDGIESDSRCALDVQCIWAGEATARLTVTTAGGESFEVMLTDNPAVEGSTSLTVVDGVQLKLLVVMPYPERAGEPIPSESYRVRILAEPV